MLTWNSSAVVKNIWMIEHCAAAPSHFILCHLSLFKKRQTSMILLSYAKNRVVIILSSRRWVGHNHNIIITIFFILYICTKNLDNLNFGAVRRCRVKPILHQILYISVSSVLWNISRLKLSVNIMAENFCHLFASHHYKPHNMWSNSYEGLMTGLQGTIVGNLQKWQLMFMNIEVT